MLLQVHDELIFEVAPGELDAVRSLVTEAMGGAADLRVPLRERFNVGSKEAAQGALPALLPSSLPLT